MLTRPLPLHWRADIGLLRESVMVVFLEVGQVVVVVVKKESRQAFHIVKPDQESWQS